MKSKSCFSMNPDPYRAGLEIGESLVAINPEIVFLFSSIHFDGSDELSEAIYEVLGNADLILIGCTSDGCFERDLCSQARSTAIGINSEGQCQWVIAHQHNIGEHPYESTQLCVKSILAQCGGVTPKFGFFTTDFRTDTCLIAEALEEALTFPVVGGSAGDDNQLLKSFVYANRRVFEDTIVMVAAVGDINFDIRVASDMLFVGRPARITACEGTLLKKIDGLDAMEFVEREIGKPVESIDKGVLNLLLTDDSGDCTIRSVLLPEDKFDETSVRLFARAREGDMIQLCFSPPETLLRNMAKTCRGISSLPFKPTAAIVISCSGRQLVLGDAISQEFKLLLEHCPSLEAMAGFPSFGEFAPSKVSPSKTLFHNMTSVVLLLSGEST